jgi:hypothetical protein
MTLKPDHFDDCNCKLCKVAYPERPPHTLGCMCLVCKAERDAEQRRAFWSTDYFTYDHEHMETVPLAEVSKLALATNPNLTVKLDEAQTLAAQRIALDPEAEVSVTLKRHQWQCVMWACCQESDYYEQADAILDQVGCDHDWREVVTSRKTFERCDLCGLTR